MRRTVLLLASATLAVLLTSGAALAFPLDEAEPNDALDRAQDIDRYFSLDNDPNIVNSTSVPHATVNGSGNETYDYYSFAVSQAGVNTLATFDIDGAMPAFDSNLKLYDGSGNQLSSSDDKDPPDPGSEHRYDSYLEYTFSSAGTYYVAVGRCCFSPVPSAGAYNLHISVQGAVTSDTPPPDTTSPDTVLVQKPDTLSREASPSIGFRSSEANSTFECKIDGGNFQPCASPKQYFLLSEGQHTFQARAKDASGNVDQTPAEHTWTVDSRSPKVTFTEKPRAVTNDKTPSWAWTIEDANLGSSDYCRLYEAAGDYRTIYSSSECSSPFNFGAELPDGDYGFWIQAGDRAGNYGYSDTSYFEVDTVAPKIVSVKPTGHLVKTSSRVVVKLDDSLYESNGFVNIYEKGSNKPLAVYRDNHYDPDTYDPVAVELSPKRSLKRDTRYTVKVGTGVNDGANNLAVAKTWAFKTK